MWVYSGLGPTGGGGASASGGGSATARAPRASGAAPVRVAIELTRRAGRSIASLTSVTMTGVIAVAMIVPACQTLDTTVAATTEATAAATSVLTSSPPFGGGAGSAEPLRRAEAAVLCVRAWSDD